MDGRDDVGELARVEGLPGELGRVLDEALELGLCAAIAKLQIVEPLTTPGFPVFLRD